MQTATQTADAAPRSTADDDFEDDGHYMTVDTARRQYLDYLVTKMPEIEEQKEGRRYYHAAQLSETDQKILEARGQPLVVINAVAKKINRIVGLTERIPHDPKAFPENPKGEAGSDIATESVRSTLGANDWKRRDARVVRQAAIEGIAGVEIRLIEGDKGDPDIGLEEVQGEDFYYDPGSVRMDFSDARFEGVAKWIDLDAAIELFPDKEAELEGLIETGTELTTYADREFRFINSTARRIRLCEHWYKKRGGWRYCFFVGNTLLDQGLSPFYDKRGKTICRFRMWRHSIDQDGDTYAFFRNLKSLQDEKNQRRSRALFISNSRRLIGEKGAVDNVEEARREWARPDGYVETNPGKTLTPDNTQFDLEAQLKFLELTNQELADFANVDAATMANGAVGNLSGVAINLLQQPGLAEIGYFLLEYKGWKLDVYETIWCQQQRYWTAERWIRLTEDGEFANWLQINGTDKDEFGMPVMVNHLGALDVNFGLEEGPETPTTMTDAYEVLKNDPTVPVPMKIELMPISTKRKKKLLSMLQAPVDPAAEAAKKLQLEGMAASNEAARAVAERERAKARETDATIKEKEASARGKDAKAFADIVGAAVDVAHFGVDAAGAALAWQQDAPVVPVDREEAPAQPALPPPMPEPMQLMPPMPTPDQGGYALPAGF